ncbi:MAG: leucine-rich repeat protein, partial [Bacteroidaceae bacterium]|nr:leucine-rich repeat protein [Bacteroidaceae bacterium]
FANSTGLTSIDIPGSVTSISYSAFGGCTGLTSIEIPGSVTSIGAFAFYKCSNLTSIAIPGSVTEIGERAFAYCMGLTSIDIPSSVTKIVNSTFDHCTGLTSIEIPGSVTYIESGAFSGCTGITSIEIPSSVTLIDYDAFSGCTNLTVVVSHIENPFPITINDFQAFGSETFLNATLYVPEGSIEKYKSTDGWKEFVHIVEGIPAPKCKTPTIVFKTGRLHLECDTEGVEYHLCIIDSNIAVTNDGDIEIPSTYTVKVYASKIGYEDSDEATITIESSKLKADVNNDGVIDAQDASLIQQYVAGKISL